MAKPLGVICFWILWPAAFLWVRNTRRVRIAVISKDDVLCIQSYCRPRKWQLPGGGIQKGETIRQAAVRELSEETGLDIAEDMITVGPEIKVTESGITYRMYPCATRISSKTKPSSVPLETAELEWIPIASINSTKEQCTTSVTRVLSWAASVVKQ